MIQPKKVDERPEYFMRFVFKLNLINKWEKNNCCKTFVISVNKWNVHRQEEGNKHSQKNQTGQRHWQHTLPGLANSTPYQFNKPPLIITITFEKNMQFLFFLRPMIYLQKVICCGSFSFIALHLQTWDRFTDSARKPPII